MDSVMKYGNWRLVLLVVAFLFLAACSGRTTAPGADIIYGTVANSAYTMLDWDEGLRILIWTDVVGDSGAGGNSSTEDDAYRLEGYAVGPDGRSFEYLLETTDGVTADFSIDGEPYDVEEGALFLVTSIGGEVEVTQLDHDLAAVTRTNDGIEAFGEETAAVRALIEQAGGP